MSSSGNVLSNPLVSPLGWLLSKEEKSNKAAAENLNAAITKPPEPAPAAKPATLAKAGSATRAKASGGLPTKARASGTIGDSGPQGLTTPPQTANLTLLGGTR